MFWAVIIYFIGSIGVFFEHNLQYINSWWENKKLLTIFIFAIPVSYCYLTSWTHFTNYFNSVWATRFLFFGLSYLIFPILAYVFLGESPFNFKTISCVLLSFLIIYIQYRF